MLTLTKDFKNICCSIGKSFFLLKGLEYSTTSFSFDWFGFQIEASTKYESFIQFRIIIIIFYHLNAN